MVPAYLSDCNLLPPVRMAERGGVSVFASMVAETGPAMEAKLRRGAAEACHGRRASPCQPSSRLEAATPLLCPSSGPPLAR